MSDFIKETWNNNAEQHKTSHWASWGDNYAISLEIENIASFIKKGDIVLDVGCSNGFPTFEQYKKNNIEIHGIDFSDNMIKYALEEKEKKYTDEKIHFKVGDIRKIGYPDNQFDIVYTTRVLINLPTWEEQIIGINECLRVVKSHGKVILSEAFWEPLVLLNSIRALKGLSPLMEHDFNRYLKKNKVEEYLKQKELKFENIDFSSIYYLGSRFLRELVTKIDDYPGYSNPINKAFFELEKEFSGGGFGIQQAYVITKK